MNLMDLFMRASGAQNFANNPANGFAPTLGDAFQGIGHSMMQHYRGDGGQYGGPGLIPGITTNPSGTGIAPMNLALNLKDLFTPQVNGGPGDGFFPKPPVPQINPGPMEAKPPVAQINPGPGDGFSGYGGVTGSLLPPAQPWGKSRRPQVQGRGYTGASLNQLF